jgi:hypothetical protein
MGHFRTFLGGFPPTPQMAVKFLAQFADRKPAALYRYNSIIKGFMQYIGEEHNHKIRVPKMDAEGVNPLESGSWIPPALPKAVTFTGSARF